MSILVARQIASYVGGAPVAMGSYPSTRADREPSKRAEERLEINLLLRGQLRAENQVENLDRVGERE